MNSAADFEYIKRLLFQLSRSPANEFLLYYKNLNGTYLAVSSSGLKALANKLSGSSVGWGPQFKCVLDSPYAKTLDLQNPAQVLDHYTLLFGNIQQIGCRAIAKSWIKEIEPNKQATYPYKNGARSRPPWWPTDIIHKEPDHIRKLERIKLLISIVRSQASKLFSKQKVNESTPARLKSAESHYASFLDSDRLAMLDEIYYLSWKETQLAQGGLNSPLIQVSDFEQFEKISSDLKDELGHFDTFLANSTLDLTELDSTFELTSSSFDHLAGRNYTPEHLNGANNNNFTYGYHESEFPNSGVSYFA